MKKLFSVVIITLIFLFAGCGSLKEANVSQQNPLDNLTSAIHTLQVSYIIIENNQDYPITRTATSWHIGGGYIITCAHCTYFPTIPKRTVWGTISAPVKTYNYRYSVDGNPVDLIGTSDDTALLFAPDLISEYSISWYDSDKLRLADEIILVGNSAMQGINIKFGNVSILEVKKPILGLSKRTAKNSFVMTNPTNGGDSGGPIFVIRDNKLLVTGMCYASAFRLQGYNMAFKSNYIIDVVKEIKENAKHR